MTLPESEQTQDSLDARLCSLDASLSAAYDLFVTTQDWTKAISLCEMATSHFLRLAESPCCPPPPTLRAWERRTARRWREREMNARQHEETTVVQKNTPEG